MPGPAPALDRYTERARQVVVLAHEEALLSAASAVEGKHLLTGLLREDRGIACSILRRWGMLDERALAEPSGGEQRRPPLHFTLGARQILATASDEASRRGESSVETEHLLAALIVSGDGSAICPPNEPHLSGEAARDRAFELARELRAGESG